MLTPSILVVEDDRTLCSLLQSLLSDADFAVNVAYGFELARHIVETSSVDLILSDLIIDGTDDGLSFLAWALSTGGVKSGILMSGHPTGRSLTEPFSNVTFLPKPFGASDVLALVRSARCSETKP